MEKSAEEKEKGITESLRANEEDLWSFGIKVLIRNCKRFFFFFFFERDNFFFTKDLILIRG